MARSYLDSEVFRCGPTNLTMDEQALRRHAEFINELDPSALYCRQDLHRSSHLLATQLMVVAIRIVVQEYARMLQREVPNKACPLQSYGLKNVHLLLRYVDRHSSSCQYSLRRNRWNGCGRCLRRRHAMRQAEHHVSISGPGGCNPGLSRR